VLDRIKEELGSNYPRANKILKVLYQLGTEAKSQQISEFYDLVGEIFMLKPGFFMKELYKDIMQTMGNMEMERYIIEKYCLGEEEKIIYELNGRILQHEKGTTDRRSVMISINSADIFITNKRIIGHGQLKASGGEKKGVMSREFSWGTSKQKERKEALVESSPVFGYEFPTKNPLVLFKTKKKIHYSVYINALRCDITIKPFNKSKRIEIISNIFDILRKDGGEVLAVIKEIYKIEHFVENMQRNTLYVLRRVLGGGNFLDKAEEFTHFSDSERIKVIVETYKLDPKFFMTSIYPKMTTWNFPPFLSLKEELFELLSKEGASI
jgi:hypothetical protein